VTLQIGYIIKADVSRGDPLG